MQAENAFFRRPLRSGERVEVYSRTLAESENERSIPRKKEELGAWMMNLHSHSCDSQVLSLPTRSKE